MKTVNLLICALGGEGGGVLTEWIVDTARHAGYPAQSTSIPGVAQRTGATTYYVEVFPVLQRELGARRPVFSLNPVPGGLDGLVSSELLETARQVGNGMPSPDRTLVITSSSRTFTTIERMQPGDGRFDDEGLHKLVASFSRAHQVFDMQAVAKDCGTVVSAVMLGAVAASGLFPFRREDYEAVVRESGASAEASLRGFARGFDIVARGREQQAYVAAVIGSGSPAVPPSPLRGEGRGEGDANPDFPPEVLPTWTLGHARVLEYQDRAYADLYTQRLQAVLDAERAADPQAQQALAATAETARWLALWMAFDDIVRVADLKSRATRATRVRREVKAKDEDLVRVWDHFKPGAPEFAALLPQRLAQRVLDWDRRRVAQGRTPWAMPLKVGTHGVAGMLALRVLASLKGLRRRGSRWAAEQALIEEWLAGVRSGLSRSARLGHEIALCGRLIKGYGATNERGKENLLHVLRHLAGLPEAAQAAQAIAEARAAALADDAGQALDASLVKHGAPPRPVKEVPVRWVRKPRGLDTAKAP